MANEEGALCDYRNFPHSGGGVNHGPAVKSKGGYNICQKCYDAIIAAEGAEQGLYDAENRRRALEPPPVSANLTKNADVDRLLAALMAYEQCDSDGVMCKVSRQAVHEAHNLIHKNAATQGSEVSRPPSEASAARETDDASPASAAPDISAATLALAQSAAAALRELVRLKAIKEALDDHAAGFNLLAADKWFAMSQDYKTNKPLAWKRAQDLTAAADGLGTYPDHISFLCLGGTYETQDGKRIKFMGIHNAGKTYETLVDEAGCNRYSRRTSDAGRVTGTAHDYSFPGNIKRPFRALAMEDKPIQYASPEVIVRLQRASGHLSKLASIIAALPPEIFKGWNLDPVGAVQDGQKLAAELVGLAVNRV